MNENAKLYVFERKEVFLIFLFVFVTAVTSFVFGVKVGKNFSFQQAGLTQVESDKVELLSGQEENVEAVVQEKSKEPVDASKLNQESHDRLKAIIDKEFSDKLAAKNTDAAKVAEPVIKNAEATVAPAKIIGDENVESIDVKTAVENSSVASAPKSNVDKYTGKWTIQLGAHRSLEEAEKFSDGFRVRGYSPIINEVNVSGKGAWFRVSLGVFETLAEAKEYVLKERSLFEGQDYVFGRFE
jgi:cell division protein FtsN